MYREYHSGFRRQVEVWPENPVDIFISLLSSRSKISFSRGHSKKQSSASSDVLPLPRDVSTGICTIADLGCGDAKIAATFNHGKQHQKAKINVLSYDLQASTPDVTSADIANLPLEPESVDVAIFCLALMGTNFLTFVDEAFRILRTRGELWVAEIKSRFNQPSKGDVKGDKDEVIVEELDDAGDNMRRKEVYNVFVKALEKRGFALRGQVDDANKMFVRMEFVKQGGRKVEETDTETGTEKMKMQKKKKLKFLDGGDELTEAKILKPCVYKLR
jgi:ribosomal RNA-processing protein 8